MATSPEQIRAGLQVVTDAARADIATVAANAEQTPTGTKAALFAAAPLIVGDYSTGSAALALDWYEELRDEAPRAVSPFTPRPLVLVTDEVVSAAVALSTDALHEIERGLERDFQEALAEVLDLLEANMERFVTDAFSDTVTGNVVDDPDAAGWKRFARPEACKFCKMLAARGAVYTEATARFAAHGAVMRGERKGGNCMCIAGPEFGGTNTWTEATPIQYMASRRERSDKDRARLRDYLNQHFPDAPG